MPDRSDGNRAPGRGRAGEGSARRRDLTGPWCLCVFSSRHPSREDVVVTGGGVVVADHGRRVEGERAQVVDAAAHASTGAAARARGAAGGVVELDRAAVERDGRGAEGGGT